MECREYYGPTTLLQVHETLGSLRGPVLFFAGGTDILVEALDTERYADACVVDLFGVRELRELSVTPEELWIGAGVTHAELASSDEVRKAAPLLALAAGSVGSPQIRNHATLGGNVANASPAADTLPALVVLGARAELESPRGSRSLPVEDLIAGPYRNTLQEREFIRRICVPCQKDGSRSRFFKLGRRRALAISRISVAGMARQDEDGTVEEIRIALGAVFPRPLVFPDVQAGLVGRIPDRRDLERLAGALADKIPEVSGIRSSTAYKVPVSRHILLRVLRDLVWIPGEEDAPDLMIS